MADPAPNFFEVLQVLRKNKVEFIVVGGICAVLHGAPVSTFDIDIVHSQHPSNIDKLLVALKDLDARYREHEPKKLFPSAENLAKKGHHLLMTKAGPLDILGRVTKERGYEDLIKHSSEFIISEEVRIQVLDLEMLITLKEETGYEKDRAVLPLLRDTLEEKKNKSLE
ncbi:MAG: hypothetical protein ABIK28_17975 [Planctomycetota bacterium]